MSTEGYGECMVESQARLLEEALTLREALSDLVRAGARAIESGVVDELRVPLERAGVALMESLEDE
jgi:hypothetical protein